MNTAMMADPHVDPGNVSPTERSVALHDAARTVLSADVLPRHHFQSACGGIPSNGDMFLPPVLAKAKGAAVFDIDGRKYLDYAAAGGTMILGHADERIIVAVNKAIAKGCDLGTPCEAEVRLARMLTQHCAGMDRVRFFVSGEEALSYAVELAGRLHASPNGSVIGSTVLRFSVGATGASAMGCDARSSSPAMVVVQDVSTLRERVSSNRDRVTAVMVEPMGWSDQSEAGALEFRALGECCKAHGVPLIVDETLVGCRLAPGETADRLGLTPDLTVIGGSLGGGFPLAVCGGGEEVMRHSVMADGAGASSCRVVLPALAAGIATLEAISEPGFHEQLEKHAKRLDAGLRAVAAEAGVPVRHACRAGMALMEIQETTESLDGEPGPSRFARYHREMLDCGIHLPFAPAAWMFVSAAHTDDDIDRTVEAARGVLAHIA